MDREDLFLSGEFSAETSLLGIYKVDLPFYYKHVPFVLDHSVQSEFFRGSKVGLAQSAFEV